MDTKGLLVFAGVGAALGAAVGIIMSKKTTTGAPGGPSANYPPPYTGGGEPVPSGTGQSFFDQLAPGLPARSQQLYEAVKSGVYDIPDFVPVQLSWNGHTGTVNVTSDALKIYGVRINIDQYYGQLVTDFLGGVMMTQAVADAIWQQAQYKPTPTVYAQLPNVVKDSAQSDMITTKAMIDHSSVVDEKLAALGDPGGAVLRANMGKDWLINEYPWDSVKHCSWGNFPAAIDSAINQGWYTGQGLAVIQGTANCHDLHHADYSQVLRFLGPVMVVDGQSMNTKDVLMDPNLAGLLTGGNALPDYRHPGVPLDAAVA